MRSVVETLRVSRGFLVVVLVIAVIGMHDTAEGVCSASAEAIPFEATQMACLFKSPKRRYPEREKYLLDKLTRIRAEVRAEDDGQFYTYMLERIDWLIEKQSSEAPCGNFFRARRALERVEHTSILSFYQYNIHDLVNGQPGRYIEIPKICAARGERWCEPALGLYVCIIDPRIQRKSMLDGVALPRVDENMGVMRIPVKYIDSGIRGEKTSASKRVYENAMKHVYKFFEGDISKEELDSVAAELLENGVNDCTVFEMIRKTFSMEPGSKESRKASMEIDKMTYYPDTKVQRRFNKKQYTISYDNRLGYLIIGFPLP